MKNHPRLSALWAGLMLCSAATVPANTLVTFQVDMSTASFDPASQTVAAHTSLNGWAAIPLTKTSTNQYVWTGTADLPTNGVVMEYKYSIEPGATWESIPKGNNRLVTLPATSGASLTLPLVLFADLASAPITVDVTFQVDMAQQIALGTYVPGTSVVYPKGTFNSWQTYEAMTNDPSIHRTNQNGLVTSSVYVGTYAITESPGQTLDYKFYIDTGNIYEDPAPGTGDPSDHNNRFFNLAYAPIATNLVTFQVDMTAQILNGSFDPSTGTVEERGNLNSWGSQQTLLTNDLAASNTNIYKTVVRIVDSQGGTEQYKFWSSVSANGGWETMADNRNFQMVAGPSQVLPVVYFNNASPADLLPVETLVTFTLNMTNAVGTDSHTFDPLADHVYLNGVPNGFAAWDTSLPELTNYPAGSRIYTIQVLLPQGSPVRQTYKYSINGADDEAASGNNHVRTVRQVGTYSFPMDTFGTPYVEPDFGQLAVGAALNGQVPVSWLGRPGVHLQTATDLTGPWQDLMATDGATWTTGIMSSNGFVSQTNYPTASARTFFRLVKP